MKRSRIGKADIDISLDFWTNAQPEYELRQSERKFYCSIDLYQTYCKYTDDENIIDEYYTKMDEIWICIVLINKLGDDILKLEKAGQLFFNYKGELKNHYQSIDQRNDNVNLIITKVLSQVDDYSLDENYDKELTEYWKKNVLDLNYYIDFYDGKKSETPVYFPELSGDEESYPQKLKKGCGYLVYTGKWKSYSEAKAEFEKQKDSKQGFTLNKNGLGKYLSQARMRNAMVNSNMALNQDMISDLCIDSIVEETKGKCLNYDQFLLKIAEREGEKKVEAGEEAKVGSFIAVFAKLIPFVFNLFKKLFSLIKNVVSKFKERNKTLGEVMTEESLIVNAPTYEDLDIDGDGVADGYVNGNGEFVKYGFAKKYGKKIIVYGALGVALLLAYNSSKKRKKV